MKRRIVIGALGVLAIAGVALLFSGPSPATPATPQSIRFAGLTNGVVGTVAPIFATLSATNAANIQRWLAAGTNGAVFIITNQQSFAIWLLPTARIRTQQGSPAGDETPLLNAPTFSGIRLLPGQVAYVQVAMLPHQGSCKVVLQYRGDSSSVNILGIFRGTGPSVRVGLHAIESDWISE